MKLFEYLMLFLRILHILIKISTLDNFIGAEMHTISTVKYNNHSENFTITNATIDSFTVDDITIIITIPV